jgi:molybdopterin-guanine dinucleotide biosynthesis protein MobB
MNVPKITGWSRSGTTRCVSLLTARGLRVSTMREQSFEVDPISNVNHPLKQRDAEHDRFGLNLSCSKHTHHDFDVDQSDKDSYPHREVEGLEVFVVSGIPWASSHEVEGPLPALPALLVKMDAVDPVPVGGYQAHPSPKLEVYRLALAKSPLWANMAESLQFLATEGQQ